MQIQPLKPLCCVHTMRSQWWQVRYTCCEIKLQWHKTIILVATESLVYAHPSSDTAQEICSVTSVNKFIKTTITWRQIFPLFHYSLIKTIHTMGMSLQFTHILSVCKQRLLQCTQPPSLQRHLFQFRVISLTWCWRWNCGAVKYLLSLAPGTDPVLSAKITVMGT